MSNILIISNDQRALALVNHFQALLESHIFAATDINKGLKEFFDKRPAVVFIQEELAGTTGEAVAKHIKTLLRQESPRLVLLRNSSTHYLLSQSSCDDFIPLPLAESALLEKFQEQLAKIPLIRWKNAVSAAVEFSATPPDPDMEIAVCRDGVPSQKTASGEPSSSSTAEKGDEPTYGKTPISRENPANAPTEQAALSESVVLSGLLEGSDGPANGKKRWVYGSGITLALLLGFGLYHYGPSGSTEGDHSKVKVAGFVRSQTPETPAVAPRPPEPITVLPSTILRSARDTGYAAAHPGWERYCTDKVEFLVFRENGAVRAVQVIALREKAITPDFYASFSKEMCGSDRSSIESKKERDGYLIEKGVAGDKTEVLIYRKKQSGEIRAFVLSFS